MDSTAHFSRVSFLHRPVTESVVFLESYHLIRLLAFAFQHLCHAFLGGGSYRQGVRIDGNGRILQSGNLLRPRVELICFFKSTFKEYPLIRHLPPALFPFFFCQWSG